MEPVEDFLPAEDPDPGQDLDPVLDIDEPPETLEPPPGVDSAAVLGYFAPIWYQDTADGGPDGQGARADIPVIVDYDGDLQHDNNWDNLPNAELLPALYAALVATETHFFLTYAHYHPRDWEPICTGLLTECHEGDMEEIQLLVERTGDGLGEIRLLRTHHHGETSTWGFDKALGGPAGSVAGPFDLEAEDGSVSAEQTEAHHHVRIFSQAKGHGLAPCRASEDFIKPSGIFNLSCPGKGDAFPGGDGVRLVPFAAAEAFSPGQEKAQATLGYAVVPIETSLWLWRSDIGDHKVFRTDGAFQYAGARGAPFVTSELLGATFDPDQFINDSSSGRSPWNLEMKGSAQADAFLDPAWAWSQGFTLPGEPSLVYVVHPYLNDAVSPASE